jgi:hypothetical protein
MVAKLKLKGIDGRAFLVGGAICLVNSDNERDSGLLNRRYIEKYIALLRGTSGVQPHEIEQ